jgi:CRP-like cAMP-binding protein
MAKSPETIFQTLRKAPIFRDVDDETLDGLAPNCTLRKLTEGELLFYQDDPGEAVFIVRSGSIAIFLGSADGRELVINEMHPGDCFGEIALFTNSSRSTSALAREISELVVIPSKPFLDVVEGGPELMRRILKMTAQRLRVSSERESALAFLDASARIARVLLQIVETEDDPGSIKITQEELAQRVGLTRQTVASTLGKWRRDGWVDTGRGEIQIIKRGVLEHFAFKTVV